MKLKLKKNTGKAPTDLKSLGFQNNKTDCQDGNRVVTMVDSVQLVSTGTDSTVSARGQKLGQYCHCARYRAGLRAIVVSAPPPQTTTHRRLADTTIVTEIRITPEKSIYY